MDFVTGIVVIFQSLRLGRRKDYEVLCAKPEDIRSRSTKSFLRESNFLVPFNFLGF